MSPEPRVWTSMLALLPPTVIALALMLAALTNQPSGSAAVSDDAANTTAPSETAPDRIALADEPTEAESSQPEAAVTRDAPTTLAEPEDADQPSEGQPSGEPLLLAAGDCFVGAVDIDLIELVPCADSHDGEVYFAFDAADHRVPEWPDEPANFVGLRVCLEQINLLFPENATTGALYGWDIAADLDDVPGSDDQRVCYVHADSAGPTTGSILDGSTSN